MKTGQTQTIHQCAHCGDDCGPDAPSVHALLFCCEGCKAVYQILAESELCDYYALNDHPGINQRQRYRSDKFAFLDAPDIAARLIRFSDGHQTHLTFYLPQMHCSSCLWLLEHIHRLHPGILSSRVDFTAREIHLIIDPRQTTIRQTVETLALAGLRQLYPADTPARLQRRLADLKLGPELVERVYGPLPPEE